MIAASLVIPSYRRQDILQETVDRFCGLPLAGWEILVIDQSAAPSAELAARAAANPHLGYHHLETPGLPNARNVGIGLARGGIVAFVDDDVVPHAGFLDGHLAPYADAGVGGVAGRVIDEVQRPRSFEGPGTGRVRRWDGRITGHFDAATAGPVDHARGCNMSFRRQALVDVGGFDVRYGGTAHLEETDVCLRVRALGYTLRFEPGASLTHLSLQTGGCRELDLARWLYWYGHNYMLFALKNLPRPTLPLFLGERLAKLAWTSLARRDPGLLVRGVAGLRDGWRSFRGRA
ncbi:MAG: glycosyltransferase [Gemmatimonadota bacterium]